MLHLKMISRKNLIKALIFAIFFVTFGFVASKVNTKNRYKYLRPPGAMSEDEFNKRCIKCGQCVAICPQKTITFITINESIKNVSTPEMIFNYTSCNLCRDVSNINKKMRCIEVCPTNALVDIKKADVKIGVAKIITENCIAYRSIGCSICEPACPEKAIRLTNYDLEPVVDEELCNGCGVCQKICPTALLGSYSGGNSKGIIVIPYNELL